MEKPPPTRAQFAWTATALAMALAVGIAIEVWPNRPQPVVTTGAAEVGGPFRLTDPMGRVVTDADFRGRAMVIYFGWANDGDMTPAALQVLSAALDRLGNQAGRIAPIFITIDPDRDTAEKLRAFKAALGPRIVVLRGTPDEITTLTRAYKFHFTRVPDAALPGGYSLAHVSFYYVIGIDGGFRGVVPHTTDAAALAGELARLAL